MSPCDRAHTTSYWCSIVTVHGSISCRFWVSMSKNVVTLKSGPEVAQGRSGSLKVVPFDILCMVSYLVFFSNCVPKMHRFWDIRLGSIQWPWNPGLGSLKVIENDTVRSGTHDFLLTFHSNHRPISHRFRDKRRYPLKIANFPTPIYSPRRMGYSWNWVSAQRSEETRMMGLPDGRKSFKIGLAVLIQYRRVTSSQPR